MESRTYLDYNATAPVQENVWRELSSYELNGNPSSQHQTGKKLAKQVKGVEDFLFELFQIDPSKYQCLFHSGATEAFNTFFNLDHDCTFVYFATDHAAIFNIAKSLELRGVTTKCLPVNKNGFFESEVTEMLEELAASHKTVWINITYMNNETGIIWPIKEMLKKFKIAENIKVHVDAVQIIGKVHHSIPLVAGVDAYTFSGHKFGSLKGIGFSFYNKELSVKPIIIGGGQQGGVRSGTLNVHGIYSLKAALMNRDFDKEYKQVLSLKNKMLDLIAKDKKLTYVDNESANTICLIHETKKADEMLILFDMHGFDISSGSACSSGSVEPSHVLLAMGYERLAKNSIRISLGTSSLVQADKILKSFESIFSKL